MTGLIDWKRKTRLTDVRAIALAQRDVGRCLLIEFQEGGQVWVPLVMIDYESDVWRPGDVGTLVVTGSVVRGPQS